MKQHQIDYIIDCLRWRDQISAAAIEVSHEAMRAHQRWLDDALAHTVWPAVTPSWFKHPTGRLTNPWPASTHRFEQLLCRHAPARTFTAHGTRATATTPYPAPHTCGSKPIERQARQRRIPPPFGGFRGGQ
ncbi:hypothetical protein [Nocardia amikacinitolerans]|uniref:hypothetical protein n=1 Tax=Nocardia amikacinitolerans TaxID=756689 RepID=UPI0020A600AA|nr:hypothetical protein [Nocardia amikacinitolerans]